MCQLFLEQNFKNSWMFQDSDSPIPINSQCLDMHIRPTCTTYPTNHECHYHLELAPWSAISSLLLWHVMSQIKWRPQGMQHTSHAIHFSTIRQYWHIYFTVKFLRFYLPHDQETSCLICHWEIDGRSTLSAFICICFRVVSHTQLAIYDITTWSLLHGVPFHHYYYGM